MSDLLVETKFKFETYHASCDTESANATAMAIFFWGVWGVHMR